MGIEPEDKEPLYEEESALTQAMVSEETDKEGTFLSGGNKREFVELGVERELNEEEVMNPKPVRSGQVLLDFLRLNLHKFDSPYAYIGGEANSPDKERYGTASVRILLSRLSTYEATSLSMSHSLLAQIFQEDPYVFVDLAFLPKSADYALLRENGFPVWFGTNSKLGPEHFDVVGISHPVSMEQLNVVSALHDSGIPIFKQQRMEMPNIPLIVLGGANSATTAPLSGPYVTKDGREWSCFVDAVIYGDGEQAGREFLRVVKEGKEKGWTKKEVLRACHGRVQGFYEPDLYDHVYDGAGVLLEIKPKVDYAEFPVKRATVQVLDEVKTLEKKILPYTGDGASVDVAISGSVGCIGAAGAGACSFCREGSEGPYRERSLQKVLDALDQATKNQGNKEVSFFSLNFNMYTHLFPLIYASVKRGFKVGLISQRVDMLAETPEQIRVQRYLKKSNFTLGVEGISQRLREYLNKNTTEEEILKVCRVFMEEGAREVKLFYIVTGLEAQLDIDEWTAFADKVEEMRKEGNYVTHFRISFTTLFPSASTALQFAPAWAAINHGTRSLDPIFNKAREINWGRRLSVSGEEPLVSNTINMGGRNITQLLLDSHFRDGYRFYGGVAKGTWARWMRRIREMPNVNMEKMWGEKDFGYVFPWEDIRYSSNKQALWDAYLKHKEFIGIKYCLTTPTKRGECHVTTCGTCDPLKEGKPVFSIIQSIVNREVAPVIPMEAVSAAARSREKAYQVRVLFEVGDPIYRFVLKGYFGYVIARALMLSSPKFNSAFIGTLGHVRISPGANQMNDWTYGQNIYDLSLCEHIPESELKEMIAPANLHLREGKILDLRMDSSYMVLRKDVDFAIYSMFVPSASRMSFARIRGDLGRYFERRGMGRENRIKVKVAHGKGMFRVEERALVGEDIRQVEYQWMPEFRGTLVRFVVTATYNPLAMLETLTGRKGFQWKPFPIFCDGYVKMAEKTGETDVFAALLGDVTDCTECGGPLELDLFSGTRHPSGVCISCDLSQYPVNMDQFFTKELQAVNVGQVGSGVACVA